MACVLLVLLGSGCTGEADPASGGAPPTKAAPAAAPAGVLLASPKASGREERNPTFRMLRRLIRATPADELIRIVGNSFSFVPVAEDLVAAHRRGVEVQVIVDERASGEWKAPALLREELGTDAASPSFLQLLPGGVHQKVWSFTRTGSSRDVVLVGSMNLTYQSARQYTDVYSYVGRRDVRRLFDRRFTQLVRRLPDVPPMRSARVGSDRVWFYPGYTQATDPVRTALRAVRPAGARIRVAMYAWLDGRGIGLAQLLAAKDAAGADVEVVLGRSVGPRVRAVLGRSGIEVHEGVFADGDDLHHKLTVVSHRGADGRRRGFVLTGSDNYTSKSLDRPEVLLRLNSGRDAVFRRYGRWMDALLARAAREHG